MDNSKKYKMDATATLRAMTSGDSKTFVIAGANRQVSLQALYKARKCHNLAVSIRQINNGTKAVVTAL